jgi:hypothetical protein
VCAIQFSVQGLLGDHFCAVLPLNSVDMIFKSDICKETTTRDCIYTKINIFCDMF